MGCGAYGCITGCARCYGAMQPPHDLPGYGGTPALYGAVQARPPAGYGEVDPATAQGFHYSVEQLRQRGLLGEEGAGLLHRGGEVLMPAGGAWTPPAESGARPGSRTRTRPDEASSSRPATTTTPIGGAALAGFAIGGVATGKLIGGLLRALRR